MSTQPDIYLHHYPMSPFAEKVRTMLGHKRLTWKSVLIPAIMPKPDVVALTGGYRKTPLLQVGNDVFCDTALIADVLEHIAPQPSLYPYGQRGLTRIVAQWADQSFFWAAMAYNFQPKGMGQLFEGAAPEQVKAFGADRGAMSTGMTRIRPADGTAAYKSYLRRLTDMLVEQDRETPNQDPFLLGTGAPSLADFAAYHSVAFTLDKVPALAGILQERAAVQDWARRMKAIGHGNMVKSNSAEAIAASAAASSGGVRFDHQIFGETEVFQDEHGIALGSEVTVAAESFGTETTQGTLLAATRTRYTVQHTDERAGTVRVHFPRVGYVLKAAA